MNRATEVRVPRLTQSKRAIRADETRRTLFIAAATVVGRRGYEGASISEITRLAGVASGTFYNYFETRQQLFDQLLPAVGDQLLEYIRSRSADTVGIEREERRITAYFEFFQQNPGFLRILNEAEVFAPQAFKQHIKNVANHYVKGLARHLERGELGPYSKDELEVIVYILMGARSYLTLLQRAKGGKSQKNFDSAVIKTYLKLVKGGLFVASGHSAKASSGFATESSKAANRINESEDRAHANPSFGPV